MTYTIIGLGNPGEEYVHTRHNVGRMMVEHIRVARDFPEWKLDKKSNALISKSKINNDTVVLVMPETFMNKSGVSAKNFVSNEKSAERMLVIYDDLDLPFGTNKMSFNKSSGGHKGLESIIKAIKTEKFPRIRIGVSSATTSGKIKKPSGEEKVLKHILGTFKPDELKELKKTSKKVDETIETWIESGREIAMNTFN